MLLNDHMNANLSFEKARNFNQNSSEEYYYRGLSCTLSNDYENALKYYNMTT